MPIRPKSAKSRRIKREDRPSANKRGYGHKWRQAREQYLKQNPLCVLCLKNGKYVSAVVVDHIIPHKGDMKLFWNRNNWQALCKQCHDRKTDRQDGGFGKKQGGGGENL